MTIFTGTLGSDDFLGLDGAVDKLLLTPLTLSTGDVVTGASGVVIDYLSLTSSGVATASMLAGIGGVERFVLNPVGISPSLSDAVLSAHAGGVQLSAGGSAPLIANSVSQTQVDKLSAGLSQSLDKIDANVVSQVWAEQLPILGNNLQTAAGSGASQLHFAANLGAAITSGLGSLTGAASYTASAVESAVNSALSAAGFGGLGVAADFSKAGDLQLHFTTQRSGDSVSTAVDQDLGLANLGLHTAGAAHTALNEAFSFTAGLDGSGFYVSTAPDVTFSINTDTRLPGFNAASDLGGLPVVAMDAAAHPSDFLGQFNLTLKDPGGDGHLQLNELGDDLIDATLTGAANVNLGVSTALPAGSALPTLGTNLDIAWNFLNSVVDPLDDNSGFGDVPQVLFTDSYINLGSFFDGMTGEVLAEINKVTAPLQPLIDFLTTPIPILSDLGSRKVTLLDAGLSPSQTAAIKGLADIINLANEVQTFADASAINIDLGSAMVQGDLRVDSADDLSLAMVRQAVGFSRRNTPISARSCKTPAPSPAAG